CGRRGLIVFVSSQSWERPRSHRVDPRGVSAAIAPARLPSHSSDGAGSHLDAGYVRRGARSARIFATRPPASRISSTFGGSALKRSTPPSGRWTSPFAMSTSITSPVLTFRRNPGHSSTGSPRLIEFRKKIRANELARIADTPSVFSAIGACSRLDPHPKLSPATIRSPAWTPLAQAGLTASKACAANTLGSVVPRYFPAIMWSVEISSPNVQTRPRKCRCIRRQESGFGTINLVSLAGVDNTPRSITRGTESDLSRVRDLPMDRGRCHGPRRSEIHLGLRRPHPTRVVPVRRRDAHLVSRERAEVPAKARTARR